MIIVVMVIVLSISIFISKYKKLYFKIKNHYEITLIKPKDKILF